MKRPSRTVHNKLARIGCFVALAASFSWSQSQVAPYERTFPQPKAAVDKAVQELRASTAGPLPVLEGFAGPGDYRLDSFQHGYYQCRVSVSSTPSGGSLVRVTAKITAWHSDSVASKSGYRVLPSNGRLEADFLDRLAGLLSERASSAPPTLRADSTSSKPKNNDTAGPTISAPTPHDTVQGEPLELSGGAVRTPFKMTAPIKAGATAPQTPSADQHAEELAREAKGLEEILRNQSHPNNLAAVKQSGTPVLVSPREGAKVMFLAEAEDEYEILDMNASWVHVRVSGLSRGWIRRSRLELPDASATETAPVETASASPPARTITAPFEIENEQMASFPADWEPLRGRTVKIVSIRQTGRDAADTGPRAKLEFAKSLLDREYLELTQSSSTAAGVALIFDSSDGGMLAATLAVLQQWKAGTLSDEALWRRCYFDPPELYGPADR